jgi:hypothetical protein
MSEPPEKACVSCHFFAVRPKYFEGGPRTSNSEERKAAREERFGEGPTVAHLFCYMGVWEDTLEEDPHSQNHISDEERLNQYVKRDRSGECFFFKHRPGMKLEAAEKLQERQEDRDRFWERNKWVRWGALAAIAAVIVNTILQLVNFFLSTYDVVFIGGF